MWNNRLIVLLALTLLAWLDPPSVIVQGVTTPNAYARVGYPATPRSAAGVARRTTRRVWRRTNTYVAALPAGCARVSLYGATVWNCSGRYYQPSGNRYVVVRAH